SFSAFEDGGRPDHRDALPALRLQDKGRPQHSSTWGDAAPPAPLPVHGLRVHGTPRRPCTGGKEAVTEMPVGMNGPRAAVDARHNMKAPTQPEDPDDRLHAAWFAEASSTDGLLAKQVPKQGGGSTSLSTSSLVPVCRLPGEEVRPAPPRRSGVIMIISIGFIFAAAAVAVISIPPHLSLLEVWRSATGGPTIDELTSSEPLTSTTPEMGNEPGTPKLIAEPSVGVAGEPAPIRLALRGRANDAIVVIRGLIPGMELSTGSAITSDSWQLSASDLPYASIAPPQDFVGSADLVAELRLPNAQIVDRQM